MSLLRLLFSLRPLAHLHSSRSSSRSLAIIYTSSAERPISRFTPLSSLSHIDLPCLHFTVGGLQGLKLVDRGDQTNCFIVMAAGEESLPKGVYRHKGKLYFEKRTRSYGKFYSAKIRTPEEGGLCHDIVSLYCNKATFGTMPGAPDGKRRRREVPLELTYPGYSPSLVLEDFPMNFNVWDNKEEAMEIILKQARAAATTLPKQMQAAAKRRAPVQKQAAHAIGSDSKSIGNGITSQQSAYSASRGAMEHPNLAGLDRGNCFQMLFDVSNHFKQCKLEYTLKVNEREELEQKVKDIKEGSGIICLQESGSDKFHEHMACSKQFVAKSSSLLEACEQEYLSQEFECRKLRKTLEDHNLKVISERLMDDGNEMAGRQRENENDLLPLVPEIYPIKEPNSSNVPPEVSAPGDLPANPPLLDVMPQGENDVAMSSVMQAPQDRSSSLLTHTSCRRENEDERPSENCVFSDSDWIDAYFVSGSK